MVYGSYVLMSNIYQLNLWRTLEAMHRCLSCYLYAKKGKKNKTKKYKKKEKRKKEITQRLIKVQNEVPYPYIEYIFVYLE